jgi:hypothetical protein
MKQRALRHARRGAQPTDCAVVPRTGAQLLPCRFLEEQIARLGPVSSQFPDHLINNQVMEARNKDQVVVGILWEFVLLRCAQSCQMQRMPRELEIDDTNKINYLQTAKILNQLYV